MNNVRQRFITLMEGIALKLENEIKKLENIRCGREEYKENVRKVKVLKLRKGGIDKAIARHKAALV